jgi:hypothetical protein
MFFNISSIITTFIFLIITLLTIALVLFLFFKMPPKDENIKVGQETSDINNMQTYILSPEDLVLIQEKMDELKETPSIGESTIIEKVVIDKNFFKDYKEDDDKNKAYLMTLSNTFATKKMSIGGTSLFSFSNIELQHALQGNFINVAKELDIHGLKIKYIDTNLDIGNNVAIPKGYFNNAYTNDINVKSIDMNKRYNMNNNSISINSMSNNISFMNQDKEIHVFDSLGNATHDNLNLKGCVNFVGAANTSNAQLCSNTMTNVDKKTTVNKLNVKDRTIVNNSVSVNGIKLVQSGSNLHLVKSTGQKYKVSIN